MNQKYVNRPQLYSNVVSGNLRKSPTMKLHFVPQQIGCTTIDITEEEWQEGIYMGGGTVIHFTNPSDTGILKLSALSSSSSSHSSSRNSLDCRHPYFCETCKTNHTCGFRGQSDSGVVLTCLNCFLSEGKLYRYQYGVHKITSSLKLRGGTCTTTKSDAPGVVVQKAMHMLHHGFGKYDLLENNCEDFALYCKTGDSFRKSGQVERFVEHFPDAPRAWEDWKKFKRGLKKGTQELFG